MSKFHFVFDTTKKSRKLKKTILKKNKNFSIKKSDIIIVAGGDGFMLRTMKKYYKLNKPFYGINSGNYGFLMNKFSKDKTYKKILQAKKIKISPLSMTVKTKKGNIKKGIAINEVSILRQSKQAASIQVVSGKTKIIKKLISDGILVSTPAGSTAYNLSVHGPILNLNSKKLSISPISAFRPRRWKGKIVSDNSTIIIKNLNIKKRPVSAVADNIEVRNARIIKIKTNKKLKFLP